ncbi:MAG: NADH-quinone oxidoreductase subunit NuoH [Anaerolineae bacterium]|nr:NADH-quinone oxidoreductase subunit NuoH [Anaerolineae bacterium]
MIEFLASQGWNKDIATFAAILLGVVACASFGLIWVIFGIWLERKVAGRIQDRPGPNRTGPYGLFQTFADIGKLLTKEDITPEGADRHVYNIAPILAVAAVIMIFAVMPFSKELIGADLNIGVVYVAAVGGLATLAILLAGWGSNNKYALLGAFRVVAALISYEVPMVLTLLIPVILAGSMSMQDIVHGQNIMYALVVPITALVFFISSLAEVGRSPFDLLEAESEIIAGFNIEYSGMKFAMFYAGEFIHAFVICMLTAVLFLGGWRGPGADLPGIAGALIGFGYLFIKTNIVYFFAMLVRSTVPRLRIDHMMAFNWKFLVPLSMINVVAVAVVSRIFAPNYAWAQSAYNTALEATNLDPNLVNRLLNRVVVFVYDVFSPNAIAEFPRFIVLLLINIFLVVLLQRILRRYVGLEQRKTRDVPMSQPVDVSEAPVASDGVAAATAGR